MNEGINNVDIKMGPTTKRIFNLNKENLLKHYALIVNKASSLSSVQRKTVEYRIGYGLKHKSISVEDIEDSLKDLSLFVAKKITDQINSSVDDDSTEEQQ